MEVVRASGLEIAYERVGEGPPLAFVHGAAEDGRVWQPQLGALADEFAKRKCRNAQPRGIRARRASVARARNVAVVEAAVLERGPRRALVADA